MPPSPVREDVVELSDEANATEDENLDLDKAYALKKEIAEGTYDNDKRIFLAMIRLFDEVNAEDE